IMFRQGLMLNGALATPHQCEALLKAAFEACERYYQAFQFVVWAGKDSRERISDLPQWKKTSRAVTSRTARAGLPCQAALAAPRTRP
ncbi:MAG TPA: YbjN domain-containing protein, partial [Hyphomicrobiaceae bacterium]|nr:YbjN domain-containing protein [Hyphomicrobiaceae bacterium]